MDTILNRVKEYIVLSGGKYEPYWTLNRNEENDFWTCQFPGTNKRITGFRKTCHLFNLYCFEWEWLTTDNDCYTVYGTEWPDELAYIYYTLWKWTDALDVLKRQVNDVIIPRLYRPETGGMYKKLLKKVEDIK